jgi:hypothetical protein
MRYNKESFLKMIMYGTLLLILLCVRFIIVWPPLRSGILLLPIMGFGIDIGVLIICIGSVIIFWYLAMKWGGQGLFPKPSRTFDPVKFHKLCQMQYNIATGQSADQHILVKKWLRKEIIT